ncbi:RNA polymerase sigma factor [Sphingobacterium faecale]|uniref:RNA polymerase sigma-70 factor n=1 Tax=Sphingobacterium faecale TaxID=2803775 RepID=A0ABS1R2W6_9SPHI|nr:RNA polymerase sigma-70 factor [Sphingobacterium faecale]MBL1409028.1 RNA polymerase sigma-70 factor [Sphingobacterium faecale]
MKNLNSISDSQLLDMLIESDQMAYTEIYSRYSKSIYVFVLRRLSDVDESQDIVQDIFLSLWNRRSTIRISGTLSSYLLTAARNKIIDTINRQKLADRYLDSFHRFLSNTVENTDYLIRHNELNTLIEDEISKLPAKMREVFELSRKASKTRKEIALELGISEQTVKSHMQHALKILKNTLGLNQYVLFVFFLCEKYFKNF